MCLCVNFHVDRKALKISNTLIGIHTYWACVVNCFNNFYSLKIHTNKLDYNVYIDFLFSNPTTIVEMNFCFCCIFHPLIPCKCVKIKRTVGEIHLGVNWNILAIKTEISLPNQSYRFNKFSYFFLLKQVSTQNSIIFEIE